MTSDHPRVLITIAALAVALGLAAGAAAGTVAGTDLEAAEVVADLPWAFEVTVEPTTEETAVRTTRYRFKSTVPIEKTAAGNIYLRATLTALEYGNARSAEAAFDELLAGADPDIGLGYAWHRMLLTGAYGGCVTVLRSHRTTKVGAPEHQQRAGRPLGWS